MIYIYRVLVQIIDISRLMIHFALDSIFYEMCTGGEQYAGKNEDEMGGLYRKEGGRGWGGSLRSVGEPSMGMRGKSWMIVGELGIVI
jgi:hypothetical protein